MHKGTRWRPRLDCWGKASEEAGNGISSGSSSDIKLIVGDLMVRTTEGICITLMSSGSEPSLNDDKVGVLASKGISPSSDENVSTVIYTDSSENDLGNL